MGDATAARRAGARFFAAAPLTWLLLACASQGDPVAASEPSASTAAASARSEPLPPPPSFFQRSTAVRTARVNAELVRRQAGEWVIVDLRSGEAPESAPGLPPRVPSREEREIQAALDAYATAIERRDQARLAQVWLMNPAQRTEVGRMFEESDGIAVSISDARFSVAGDRAQVAFDQSFSLVRSPRIGSAFGRAYRRAMAASDAVGNWALESLSLK